MAPSKTLLLIAALVDLSMAGNFLGRNSVKISSDVSSLLANFFAGEEELETIKENEESGVYASQNHPVSVLRGGDNYPVGKVFKVDEFIDYEEQYRGDKFPPSYHKANFINKLIKDAIEALKLSPAYETAVKVFKDTPDTFHYFTPLLMDMLKGLNDKNLWSSEKIEELLQTLIYVPKTIEIGQPGESSIPEVQQPKSPQVTYEVESAEEPPQVSIPEVQQPKSPQVTYEVESAEEPPQVTSENEQPTESPIPEAEQPKQPQVIAIGQLGEAPIPAAEQPNSPQVITVPLSYLDHIRENQWQERSSTCASVYSGNGFRGKSYKLSHDDEPKRLSDLTQAIGIPKSIHTEPGCTFAMYSRYDVKQVSRVIPYSTKSLNFVDVQCSGDASLMRPDPKCVNTYQALVEEKYFECKCYNTSKEKKEKFLKPLYQQQKAIHKEEKEEQMVVYLFGFTGNELIRILGEELKLPRGEWLRVLVPVGPTLEVTTLNLNQDPMNKVLIAGPALKKVRFEDYQNKCKDGSCRSLGVGLLEFDTTFIFRIKEDLVTLNNILKDRMDLEYLKTDSASDMNGNSDDVEENLSDFLGEGVDTNSGVSPVLFAFSLYLL